MTTTRNIRVTVDAETIRNAQALEKLTGTPYKAIIGTLAGRSVQDHINALKNELDLHIPAPGEVEAE